MKAIDLTGQVAIVTGGAGRIGGANVRALAEAGAKVYAADLFEDKAIDFAASLREEGLLVEGIGLDVNDSEAVERSVRTVYEREGRIDILINTAGVLTCATFTDSSQEIMEKLMQTNVYSMGNIMREVLKYMIPARFGKIVNIASISGRQGSLVLCDYSVSNFARIGMTQAAAKEVGQYGINVNAVCPGVVDTPIHAKVCEGLVHYLGHDVEWFRKEEAGRSLFGTMQTPEDIANCCLFLASDLAKNITGQAINVDGGIRMN